MQNLDELVKNDFDDGFKKILKKHEVFLVAISENTPNQKEIYQSVVNMFRDIYGHGVDVGMVLADKVLKNMSENQNGSK